MLISTQPFMSSKGRLIHFWYNIYNIQNNKSIDRLNKWLQVANVIMLLWLFSPSE